VRNVENKEKRNSCGFLAGAFVGGVIGAAAALILAPKSGRELRRNLTGQADVFKEKASSWVELAKEKGIQWTCSAKEKSSELASATKDKAEHLSKTVQSKSGEMAGKIQTITSNAKEKTIQMADKVSQRFQSQNGQTLDEVSKKLEETKQAFEKTEKSVNKND